MPGRHSHVRDLSPVMREGARLEALGTAATEIASTLSVNVATVSRWRADERYQAHVSRLLDAQDRDALREARATRARALKVVNAALARGAIALQAGDLSPSEASTLGRMGLDVYRATSAQTGLAETTRSEVAVSTSWRDAAADLEGIERDDLALTVFDDGADDADEE